MRGSAGPLAGVQAVVSDITLIVATVDGVEIEDARPALLHADRAAAHGTRVELVGRIEDQHQAIVGARPFDRGVIGEGERRPRLGGLHHRQKVARDLVGIAARQRIPCENDLKIPVVGGGEDSAKSYCGA
jgi:hypothetical protein